MIHLNLSVKKMIFISYSSVRNISVKNIEEEYFRHFYKTFKAAEKKSIATKKSKSKHLESLRTTVLWESIDDKKMTRVSIF